MMCDNCFIVVEPVVKENTLLHCYLDARSMFRHVDARLQPKLVAAPGALPVCVESASRGVVPRGVGGDLVHEVRVRHDGMRPVLAARHWSDPEGNALFPAVPGPLKPKKRLWFASAAQLGRFPSLDISDGLASRYLNAPPGEDYERTSTVVLMRAFALCYAQPGDESRPDVDVVPLDWNTRTQTSAYERVLRESADRVADERARAADVARLERKQARERNLAARQNCVTVEQHAPTLGADADLAQKEAAVANAIALLPDDILNFSL